MKLARLFWSLGSILINGIIGIYIYMMSQAPQGKEERYQYINEHWDVFGSHWKVELLLMTLIAVGALYFAFRTQKISWTIVSVGQLILLLTYPFMLGGYRNTPIELAVMANEMATVVFIFGNVIFFTGLFLLYMKDVHLKRWLRIVAFSLSGIMLVVFLIVFAEVITWGQALAIAPLANIMYLINAYYGFKMTLEPQENS
ncbi:hypothetical protein [Flagellimonas meridianipacifica]|uniref:DUF998 domain-containing protein n=1 Tax=Flagellimonas meridianipacifica TaxID=1080225 RepID=A0A2T0MHB5_9FLAO|nr:hypothetical protein [Allomuricauda pacifica]PRX56952.1 hypothetical protein CLV81_0953 [Allomuricauda pacifica]